MIKAILFDVFGTVVDWRSGLVHGLERTFARAGLDADAPTLADAWHEQCRDSLRADGPSPVDGHAGDASLARALSASLAEIGLDGQLSDGDTTALPQLWRKLPPWPDSVPGLKALKREYVIAPRSNGSVALMTWLAKHAGLPWDVVLALDSAATQKDPASAHVSFAAALGLAPDEVMMVSAHNADLYPARAAGLKTAFFARPVEHGPAQSSDLEPSEPWDVVAFDLLDLARQMESATRY